MNRILTQVGIIFLAATFLLIGDLLRQEGCAANGDWFMIYETLSLRIQFATHKRVKLRGFEETPLGLCETLPLVLSFESVATKISHLNWFMVAFLFYWLHRIFVKELWSCSCSYFSFSKFLCASTGGCEIKWLPRANCAKIFNESRVGLRMERNKCLGCVFVSQAA